MNTKQIGARIKKLRQARELSLEEIASRTGLDADFLKAVEHDSTYPSLGPLLKISRALGTRLGTFLDDRISQDPLIIRLQERQEELNTHKGKGQPVSHRFFSLGRGKNDRHMEPFFVRLMPEQNGDRPFSSHEGEEFIVVQAGRVQVTYGDATYTLEPGDSIYYNSIVPHDVACLGNEPAEIYAVLYIPN
jgi:transcriptional regulator with XRE-family HTH domain